MSNMELRLAGSGGQGVILATVILAGGRHIGRKNILRSPRPMARRQEAAAAKQKS